MVVVVPVLGLYVERLLDVEAVGGVGVVVAVVVILVVPRGFLVLLVRTSVYLKAIYLLENHQLLPEIITNVSTCIFTLPSFSLWYGSEATGTAFETSRRDAMKTSKPKRRRDILC